MSGRKKQTTSDHAGYVQTTGKIMEPNSNVNGAEALASGTIHPHARRCEQLFGSLGCYVALRLVFFS